MSATTLAAQRCEPCAKGDPPMPLAEARALMKELPDWRLSDDGKALEREYRLKDFLAARDLINDIARVAEEQDHHPDLHLTDYRRLRVVLSTHSIGGLSRNDFILAARIENLPKK